MADVAYANANYEHMGPTLLAQQPPNASDRAQKDAKNWDRIFQHLESRLGMLRNWRYSWWAYWAVLAQFFDPKRYTWLVVANKMWRGSPLNDSIIDSTGLQALRTCAAGMWSGLTNPSRPWLKLESADPGIDLDADAKTWLESTEESLYTVFAQSNFYDIMAQAFRDEAMIGTAPVICYEDFEDVARFYLPCAGEYYLGTGARLENDTLYREFTFNVIEIVEFAGHDNCPAQVQKQYEEGGASLQIEYVVAHAIEPNFRLSGKGRSADDVTIDVVPGIFVWREVYWLKGIKTPQPLSIRGFHEQPFACFLWERKANDAYGRSPCMEALGDNKQVQTETRRKAEFIEKGVRPPMGADPQLKNEPYSIMPGQVTFFSTDGQKKGFFPLFEPNAQWLAGLVQDIDKVNARIEKCLYVDVFMAITRMEGVQPRNELELTKRDLERLQALGPVIELAEHQLAIIVRRVLAIMGRRRVRQKDGTMGPMLKPLPQSLHGVPIKIGFVSLMRLAQRSAQSVSMKDTFATLGELSSAAKAAGVPDPLRTMKLDAAARKYGDVNNFPTDLWFTPEEVLEQDKARHQATQQTQMPGQAAAAVNAAKTLAETPMGGNTALSALVGNPGGGGAAPAI
jgi:Bacteriophage head to tail connecting protein